MRVHAHIPVGEIAASLPHTTKVFDLFGIDYVCHGNLSLHDACAEAGVDPSAVRQAIEALPRTAADEPSWADASMQDVMNELRDHRHPALRKLLRHTATVVAETPSTPEVVALRDAFTMLCEDLLPHMAHEENMLFPVVQHLEDCWTRGEHLAMNFTAGIAKPLASLIGEHGHVIARLKTLHDAAAAVRDDRLRAATAELEHELREHIHLENNVLYPRATAIEAAVSTTPVVRVQS